LFEIVLSVLPICFANAGKLPAKKNEILKLNQFIEEGKILYEEGNYQGALERWTEALKLDPWNDEVKKLIDSALKKLGDLSEELNKGFEYLENNNLDKAEEIFDNLSKIIEPKDEKNYELLQKGINILEEKRKKEEFNTLLEKGDKYLNSGKIDLAERTYKDAERLSPGDKKLIARFQKIEKIRKEIYKKREITNLKSKAQWLFDNGKFKESKEIWENILKLNPNDEDAVLYISKINFKEREKARIFALGKLYYETGISLYKQKKYNEAIDQFENAIAVNYKVEESQKYISKLKNIMLEVKKKRNEEKIEKVAKYLKEGIKLYNLNKFKEALAVLNKGLTLDPENTQIKEYIIIVSVALKHQEEKKVPVTSPFYPLITNLKRLGKNAYESGNYLEAIRYYEEILLIFPFNEYAKVNVTKVLKKTDPKLALDILNNMINEAKGLIAKGKKREAMERIKTVLGVDPDNKKAKLFYNQLKLELVSAKKVVTKDMKEKAEKLYSQGVESYQREDLKGAISLWKKAVSIYPNFVEARISLAKAETKLRNLGLIKAGKEENQLEDISMSIKIKRHYIDGLNYYMSGLYKEAISEWKELLKLNPKNRSFREKIEQNIQRAEQRLEMRG